MMSHQNIRMVVLYHFYGVAKAARVCDKNKYVRNEFTITGINIVIALILAAMITPLKKVASF
jgi:hypothetical protein